MTHDPVSDFDYYHNVATNNYQNIKDEIQNAWIAYLAIMTEPQLSGFDVLGAINTAVGLIPGVGGFVSAAMSIGGSVSAGFGEESSPATTSVAQLKQIDKRINARLQFFNSAYQRFRAATSDEEKERIAIETFPEPLKPLTDVELNKLAYVIEYGLFKRYVQRKVIVSRTVEDRWLGPDSEGPWSVQSGLSGKQEEYIYYTFGGGNYFDYSKAASLIARTIGSRLKGDYIETVKAGWEFIGMELRPVRGPYSLVLNWGAKKTEIVLTKRFGLYGVSTR